MPNITGYAYPMLGYETGMRNPVSVDMYSGALMAYGNDIWTSGGVNVNSYGNHEAGISINASFSSPIYGKQPTVIPNSLRVRTVCRT